MSKLRLYEGDEVLRATERKAKNEVAAVIFLPLLLELRTSSSVGRVAVERHVLFEQGFQSHFHLLLRLVAVQR